MIQAHSSFLALMWFCRCSICGPAIRQITELSFLTFAVTKRKIFNAKLFLSVKLYPKHYKQYKGEWPFERKWKGERKKQRDRKKVKDCKEGYKQKQRLHTKRLWMNYSLWCQINKFKPNHQDKTVSQCRRRIMSPKGKISLFLLIT